MEINLKSYPTVEFEKVDDRYLVWFNKNAWTMATPNIYIAISLSKLNEREFKEIIAQHDGLIEEARLYFYTEEGIKFFEEWFQSLFVMRKLSNANDEDKYYGGRFTK